VIQVWDAETGKRLATTKTGPGATFSLSPDWSTVYVSRLEKRKATRIEKEGKVLNRWTCEGDVRAWDLNTGRLHDTFKHDPRRGIENMVLSPDGSTFVTFEELPGDWKGAPKRSASLWDVKSKKWRQLPEGVESWAVYSPDGRTLAAPTDGENGGGMTIKIIDVVTAQVKRSILTGEKNTNVGYIAYSPDGSLLVGQVRSPDYRREEHWLKFWNSATGQEIASFEGEKKDLFFFMAFSPDGRTLAVGNIGGRRGAIGKLFLFDVAERRLAATVMLGEKARADEPIFSPDGKWIAVQAHEWPDGAPEDEDDWQNLPQPRILLIDAANGAVRETLVAPRNFTSSACFSPDGKTLATAETGKVLLWDLTKPPGALGSANGR
jgi:WD40 repeat protein